MYNNDWHVRHREKTRYSAGKILELLFRINRPRSVLDLGCGQGDWLSVALELGAQEILGCDGPWAAREAVSIPPQSFLTIDLRKPLQLDRKFDLAICLEVAEHVPELHADGIVQSLADHSDMIFFGAAIPFQGGYRHVNEQWPSWWGAKFAARGYVQFDPVRRAVWEDPSVHFWYKQNAFLYLRRERQDLMARAKELEVAGSMPIDVVHPEKYLGAAAYQSIAIKPLLKALPTAVAGKVRSALGLP